MSFKISLIACAIFATPGGAQKTEETVPYRQTPLFESDSVIHLTLTMDQRTVRRDIDSTKFREHPAVLSYSGPDGSVDLEIQVRTRGHFRRQRRNCNFPPLRLNIKTGAAEGSLFEDQDKIKLVTHCQNGRDEHEQYLILEALVYKTLNVLTDRSFRVRQVIMTYVDTESREDTLVRRGILLESEDEMLARTGATLVETEGIHPMDTEYNYMGLVDMFEFLVGNTDWSVSGLHNIVMTESDFAYYAVPYDFDWTGMVNARYARPNETLRIRRVTDRLYRGYCRSPDDFQTLFAFYNEKSEAIYDIYRNEPGLEEKTLKKSIEFLDKFYEIINDEGKARREILRRCHN